jgi:hypothetical protein
MDSNEEIEPESYVPIVPMILINGTSGIRTGGMIHFLKFNPRHIVDFFKQKLDGKQPFLINLWLKGNRADQGIVIIKKNNLNLGFIQVSLGKLKVVVPTNTKEVVIMRFLARQN